MTISPDGSVIWNDFNHSTHLGNIESDPHDLAQHIKIGIDGINEE